MRAATATGYDRQLMRGMRHILGTMPVAKVAAGALVLACVGAGAFGVAQLGAEAFDPSAFLGERINQQGQPDFNAAFDVDRSEADGEANMEAEEEQPTPENEPEIQEVDASSFSQTEGGGSSALSVVDTPAAGGTVVGTTGSEGSGGASDNPAVGPVINGEGNGSGGEGSGEGQGGSNDGPGGNEGNTPTPPPAVDPDPRPSLPDDMYDNVDWINPEPFPETGVVPKPDEDGTVSIGFSVFTEEYMLEDPDDLGMERIYYGMYLDDWKLLCATYFYVTVNGTMYRLENYSDNFKIGDFPEVLTSDTLEVDFFFRLNANDKWQTERVKYLVHPNKVVVTGWNGESVKTRYPAAGQSVYLDDLFTNMLPAGSSSGTPLAQMFPGWAETEGGAAVGSAYLPTRKGRIELHPLPLVPVPPAFKVANIWNKQALVGYTGTSPVCLLPEGIQSIDLPFGTVSAEVIRIPASLQYGAGSLTASRSYEVAEGNTTFHVQDGMLFETDTGALYGIPTSKETVVIPSGTPVIVFPEHNSIKRIELVDLIEGEYFEVIHDAQIVVPADRYVEFLAAWGAHPGNSSNTLVPDTGSELDYAIRDGAAYTSDGTMLVEVLPDTRGTFFVPEGVRVVKEGAFAKCSRVDTAVLPQSVEVLERESLVGEGLTRVLFEGTTPPVVDAEAFGEAKAHVRFATYDSYLRLWGEQLGAAAAEALLVADDFSAPDVNGYHLLSLAPRAADGTPNTAANEVIVLRAPEDVTRFVPDTLGDFQLTALGPGAFQGCTALTAVELAPSVKSIGDEAFANCPNLEALFSASPDTITLGSRVFNQCSRLKMVACNAHEGHVANPTEFSFASFAAYAPYGSVGYDEGVPEYYPSPFETTFNNLHMTWAFGGALLYGDAVGYDQLCLLGATTDVAGDISLESNTAVIYESAFANCEQLTSIDTASMAAVEEIYDFAFGYSGLTSIVISPKASYVGEDIFVNCASLERVTIEEGLDTHGNPIGLRSVSSNMFVGCAKLTSVTLPSTVRSVYYGAFTDSGVSRITCTGATAPLLIRPNPSFPFVFSENPPDDFKVELAGAAAGQMDVYIETWKRSLTDQPNDVELTPEEDLAATNAARALFGLPALEALPQVKKATPREVSAASEGAASSEGFTVLEESASSKQPAAPEPPVASSSASGADGVVDPLASADAESDNEYTAHDAASGDDAGLTS